MIEVAHGCKAHFTQSLWGSWGWQSISVVQPARVNIILPYAEHILCDVFVLFCRFGVVLFFPVRMNENVCDKQTPRVWEFEFGDFPLCAYVCACFLFWVRLRLSECTCVVWSYAACWLVVDIVIIRPLSSRSLYFLQCAFVFYIYLIFQHTK